jgi:outer membrane receptor protein involved in Fe transport
VHRAGDSPTGLIERVDNLFINLANQKISGVDLEMNYRHNLTLLGGGPESVLLRFFGTYLHENSVQNKGGTRDERAGQVGPGIAGASALPKYKITSNVNYRNGPFSVFLQGRWIDGGLLDRLRIESDVNLIDPVTNKALLTINDNHVASIFYTDLNLSWTAGAKDNLNVYFNMTNVFDRAPPLAPNVIGRAGTQEFNSGIHDVVGRRYVVGLNYEF